MPDKQLECKALLHICKGSEVNKKGALWPLLLQFSQLVYFVASFRRFKAF
jgi:hypothetical protein